MLGVISHRFVIRRGASLRRSGLVGFAWLGYALMLWPLALLAQHACDEKVPAQLRVDQGHPWRPPFGLERVGSPLIAHVEIASQQAPAREYYLAAYRDDREIERRPLSFQRNPNDYSFSVATQRPAFFAHGPLTVIPSEVALWVQCAGHSKELARQPVAWPEVEADARARPDGLINPIDLGTVMVPHDWLLLTRKQQAIIDVAAFSRGRDLSNAIVRAWFTGGKPIEIALPLAPNRKATRELRLPLFAKGERTVLHVSLTDGDRELWKKDIRTMIVTKTPKRPRFGAVETKLRYDAPIVVIDPKTGAVLPSIDYNTAWDEKLKDVVVFLPDGSRFVFWRGSSYIPFWAGRHNTGLSYQWAETFIPPAERDADAKDFLLEPLFDKELRYSRVRILESSASRVHVRWTYQLTDYRHRVFGDHASEDYYFYPDGFGTRVVDIPSALGSSYQVSEFIILTPQAAYPLEVLPGRMLEVLSVDGGKGNITFPVERRINAPEGKRLPRIGLGLEMRRSEPTLYRIFTHKDDPTSAIYFHPRDTSPLVLFPPFYDEGQLVTPVYWGNHWPLSRGGWTGWTINERITATPGHNSLAWPLDAPIPGYEPKPDIFESVGQSQMLDALGRPRDMTTRRWAWMIAMTDLPDAALIDWAKSFSAPPALEVTGARVDFPSYSAERRALRLVAEQPAIEIMLKPQTRTVNPVFEIAQAPWRLASVSLDGNVLPADAYAWDGSVLWIKATIADKGALIGVRFR